MLQFRRIVFSVVSALALAAPVYAGKLAIVIDDFGYRPHYENQVLAMPSAISVAVLPNAPHAREMATKAHSSGHQVLIHLPMAPLSKQPLEKDTLRPDMSSEEIERIIRDAYNKVPYAVGLNNHMGSAMTSSLYGMLKVMQALREVVAALGRRTHDAIEAEVDRGDVAWGGNWFFLVNNHRQEVLGKNVKRLTEVSLHIKQALVENGITGNEGAEIDHIELFGAASGKADSKSFVLCPGAAYDRSPCGTGTSAKLACLADDGKLLPQQIWRQESVIGSIFEASYVYQEAGNPAAGIIPTIRGSAHVCAETTLILNPDDPFCFGIQPD